VTKKDVIGRKNKDRSQGRGTGERLPSDVANTHHNPLRGGGKTQKVSHEPELLSCKGG